MKREEIIEQGMRLLRDVKEDEHFRTVDGRALRSVRELVLLLETFSDEHFRHHVNEHRNDFAAWVEHSIGDPVLAGRIRDASSKQGIQRAISARLAELEQQLLAVEHGEPIDEPAAHRPAPEPDEHEPGPAFDDEAEEAEEEQAGEEIEALVDETPEHEAVDRDELLEEIETAIAQAQAQLKIERAQEARDGDDLTGEPDIAIDEGPAEPKRSLFAKREKTSRANEPKKERRSKPKKMSESRARTSSETAGSENPAFSFKDFFMGMAFGALIGGVAGAIIGMTLL